MLKSTFEKAEPIKLTLTKTSRLIDSKQIW